MEWLASITKSIEYIENHLLENINYEDIAKHVNISSYEFHRTFSILTGMTVSTYLRNRKLSLAGKEIVESNVKIIDIAFKYGYETPESFTKAFTRFHGIAPKYARSNLAKLKLFNPLTIKIIVEGGNTMDYKIIQTKKQKFIAIKKAFKNEIINEPDNHDIPDFWDECSKNNIINKLLDLRVDGKKDLYGLCSPSIEGQETFDYGIGVLIDDDTINYDEDNLLDLGLCIWNVEEDTYAVFDCIGDTGDCISLTWERFFKEFLPQMGYEASKSTDYEIYYQNSKEGLFCELWIPIKIK